MELLYSGVIYQDRAQCPFMEVVESCHVQNLELFSYEWEPLLRCGTSKNEISLTLINGLTITLPLTTCLTTGLYDAQGKYQILFGPSEASQSVALRGVGAD